MTAEDRVFAKCQWRLIPLIAALYLVSIIDRLNVGLAALTMNADLGFSPAVFGLGAGIFFVGYFLFQVPANLVLQRIGARRWIFSIVLVWGTVSAACAFVEGPISFYVLRFLLGVAEAGLFPGMILYFTFWFPHSYQARLTASFMSASPFAFIIGGPLAGFILGMDGLGGLRGWQWLFLIEAAPALLLAFAVLRMMPDAPGKAAWLSAEEKSIIARRLAAEHAPAQREFWPALKDPRVWALGFAYMAVGAGSYGMRLWLPQIVQGMGFSIFATSFVVALPFALAMPAMIWWGRVSDKKGERIWHVVLPMLLAAGGFIVAGVVPSDLVVLIAIGVVVLGLDAVIGPFWSLPSSFLKGAAAAGGIALINTFGTGMGGFLGSNILGILRELTGGYEASMIVLAIGLLIASLIVLGFGRFGVSAPLRTPASTG